MSEWADALRRAEDLPRDYAEAISTIIAPLAERIAGFRGQLGRPVVIGISGAQGTGKTTMALFLERWLSRELGLSCACLSLDDLYLAKGIRLIVAETLHPMFATRGVPGTHDVGLGKRLLDALTDTSARDSIALPAFDKLNDDRLDESRCRRIQTPVDVVLFEGWCVGARPQSADALDAPVNELEATADPNGVWRRHVNERLATDYQALFARIDALIMLRVAGFESVFSWRRLQELKSLNRRRADNPAGATIAGQTDAELARFVMHYERLTRHMLESMPDYADTIIDIDDAHRMAGVSHPGWGIA